MSRVFRYKNGAGFKSVGFSGPTQEASASVVAIRKIRAKKKGRPGPRPGSIVAFAVARSRRKQVSLHELPRTTQLATCVDSHCAIAFKDAAEARGLTRGALLGAIIEAMVEDNLFDAILDDMEFQPCKGKRIKQIPRH